MNFIPYLLGIVSQILIIKYLVLKKIKIRTRHTALLISDSKNEKSKIFVLEEEFLDCDENIPEKLSMFVFSKKLWYYIDIYNTNKESPHNGNIESTLWIFRWKYKRLESILRAYQTKEWVKEFCNVYITNGRDENYLGVLPINANIEIPDKYKDIEKEFIKFNENKVNKFNFLLYGEPGNGKTTLIRNLATKYGYDLYFVDLTKETSNTDILKLTTFVKTKSIILFEDFDSVYNKRELLKYKDPNFTFDSILNLLDGIYNVSPNVVFVFTANDISKIDDSIMNRRGRIKIAKEVLKPNYEERMEILQNGELALSSEGMTLDNIYNLIN